MRRSAACLLLALVSACGRKTADGGYATDSRNAIRIVASPTAFPAAAAAAERFARSQVHFRVPVVESMAPAAAAALFCGGTGPRFPDALATRRLDAADLWRCAASRVGPIATFSLGSANPGGPVLYVKRANVRLVAGLRELTATLPAGTERQHLPNSAP